MGRALLTIGWMATAGLVATAILGYRIEDARGFDLHLLFGLAAAFLLLFSHCWIMFYLIGTGKAIKEAVAGIPDEAEIVEETKRFKNESYPAMMLAMGVVMAAFILGGGVPTKVIPAWIHHGLFYAALLVQLRALLAEHRVLAANERLMDGLRRRAAKD